MKIFLDSGSVDEVKKALSIGILDGVTTNPSLVAKEGRDFETVVSEIGNLFDKAGKDDECTVSAECVTETSSEMIQEAHQLVTFHKRVIVKVPMTPDGMTAVQTLSKEGIRTNVTLCFSAAQALLAAKAGATYISPFIGRIDDMNQVGMDLISEIRTIYDNYDFPTKLLAASVRLARQVVDVALLGADIVTIPYKVYEQLYQHPLTDVGLKKFLTDWNSYQAKKTK